MRTKRCKRCGAVFETDREGAYMCPLCSKAAKIATVVRPRTCIVCGVSFTGGPSAKYCQDCRREKQRERDRQHKQRGSVRPLGSIDVCKMCGMEYVVEGGLQKYCKACSEEAIKANARPRKRAYNQEHKEDLYEHKAKMRQYNKVCLVCGKVFDSDTVTVTCSEECAKARASALRRERNLRSGRLDGSKPRVVDHQSGIPGITWHKKTEKWQLKVGGKYIGLFPTVEEAAEKKGKIEAESKEKEGVEK